MTADPWAGVGAADPEPRWITREDRVEQAARADFKWHRSYGGEHGEYEELPYETRLEYRNEMERILDAAYPVVATAAEIEALPMGTVIINDHGTVKQRVGVPLTFNGGGTVGTGRPWQTSESHTREKLRQTSEDLAKLGPWTVVHRRWES